MVGAAAAIRCEGPSSDGGEEIQDARGEHVDVLGARRHGAVPEMRVVGARAPHSVVVVERLSSSSGAKAPRGGRAGVACVVELRVTVQQLRDYLEVRERVEDSEPRQRTHSDTETVVVGWRQPRSAGIARAACPIVVGRVIGWPIGCCRGACQAHVAAREVWQGSQERCLQEKHFFNAVLRDTESRGAVRRLGCIATNASGERVPEAAVLELHDAASMPVPRAQQEVSVPRRRHAEVEAQELGYDVVEHGHSARADGAAAKGCARDEAPEHRHATLAHALFYRRKHAALRWEGGGGVEKMLTRRRISRPRTWSCSIKSSGPASVELQPGQLRT